MRDQIAKLAEAQKKVAQWSPDNETSRGREDHLASLRQSLDAVGLLAEFDRLSKIEAAARAFRKRYLLKRFEPAEIHLLMAGDALDAALNAKGQP